MLALTVMLVHSPATVFSHSEPCSSSSCSPEADYVVMLSWQPRLVSAGVATLGRVDAPSRVASGTASAAHRVGEVEALDIMRARAQVVMTMGNESIRRRDDPRLSIINAQSEFTTHKGAREELQRVIPKPKQVAALTDGANRESNDVFHLSFVAVRVGAWILAVERVVPIGVLCVIISLFIVCVTLGALQVISYLPQSTPEINIGSDAAELDSHRQSFRWRVIAVGFSALFLDALLVTAPVPILPRELACGITRREGCLSDSSICVLLSSKPAIQIAVIPIMASMVDRIGPLAPMRWSFLILTLSTVGFALGFFFDNLAANTIYPGLFAARAVQGVGSAAQVTGSMTLVRMYHHSNEMGTASGIMLAGEGLGVLFGPVLGGVVAQHVAAWVAFLIIGVAIAIGGVAQSALLHGARMQTAKHNEEEDPTYTVWTDPLVLIIVTTLVISTGTIAMLEVLLPLHLARAPFHLGTQTIGVMWSAAAALYAAGAVLAGLLSDFLPKWTLVVCGLYSISVSVFFIFSSHSVWLTVVFVMICGFGAGFIATPATPLLMEIADFRKSTCYARYVASLDMALNLGMVLGPVLAALGTLYNTPYDKLTYIAGDLCLLCVPAIAYLATMVVIEEPCSKNSELLVASGTKLSLDSIAAN